MLRKFSQLSYLNKQNFCIFKPYLQPERHINMSHNFQNSYEDLVMIGDYPIAPRSNDKVLSRKYEQIVMKNII
jgi:hypothetical protein